MFIYLFISLFITSQLETKIENQVGFSQFYVLYKGHVVMQLFLGNFSSIFQGQGLAVDNLYLTFSQEPTVSFIADIVFKKKNEANTL